MMNLAALLADVNDKGASVSRGTLVTVLIILAIVVLLLMIFAGRRWPWRRP